MSDQGYFKNITAGQTQCFEMVPLDSAEEKDFGRILIIYCN
jgi:hypothetical protein